jgi:hypothetical protein
VGLYNITSDGDQHGAFQFSTIILQPIFTTFIESQDTLR